LLEGERIVDRGPQANPRFLTTDTVQGFAPLDQYLMGWRRPEDVPDTFLVTGAPAFLQQLHPLRGYSFDGQRRDVSISEMVQTMGRRTPDSTRGAAAIPVRIHSRDGAGDGANGCRPG
jgi:hypothetical protein